MSEEHYFIGTSGWSYPQWKNGLYKACPRKNWLSCYAATFHAVELNSSFYRLPAQASIKGWVERTPEHFRFALKAWRAITHNQRLQHCEKELAECLRLFRHFGGKLGPVLFQLPPSLQRDDALLAGFLALLPDDMRFVFEFRHASWLCEPVYARLQKAGVGLCQSHMKQWQEPRAATGDIFYVRLHGSRDWFKGAYPETFLKELAAAIRASKAREAYVFFNNTLLGDTAADNAAALQFICRAGGS